MYLKAAVCVSPHAEFRQPVYNFTLIITPSGAKQLSESQAIDLCSTQVVRVQMLQKVRGLTESECWC